MSNVNRRTFIQSAAVTGAALSGPAVLAQSRTKKYKTCTIGSGWWGMNITRYAIWSGECDVTALSDADRNHLDPAAEEVEEMTGKAPKKYMDYREMLEKEKPEIVIVGSPDHWHALHCIDACNAGAHVYVEKPISHTILEGKAMVKAARDNDRVVQVGTHRRVGHHNLSGIEFLRSGKVGKIGMVRAFVHYPGGPGQPTPNEEPPEGLDWDMWCGPGPLVPFNPTIHPRGFRRHLDFANGQLGDWGIHWLDQILWWSEEKHPKSVYSTAARHIKQDSTDAPDTQIATFEFEDYTAYWEHRFYGANHTEKTNIGCYFYGTNGIFHMGWIDGWTFYPDSRDEEIIHEEAVFDNEDRENIKELFADFLDAIKNNRRPVCDIEIGQQATNMSLLGMLSWKLGRSVKWDGPNCRILDDPEANELLKRDYRGEWEYPMA